MLTRRAWIRLGLAAGFIVAGLALPLIWKALGGRPDQTGGSLIEFVRFASGGLVLGGFWFAAGVALPRLSEFLQRLIAIAVYLLIGLLLWWLAYDIPWQWDHAFNLVVLWPMEFALWAFT